MNGSGKMGNQKNASDCRMTAAGGVFVPNYVKCQAASMA